ncbi:hypothetical protein ORJ00_14415 [Rheinheimera baltica]|uniref:hypothetical protein n=1 Tax=Rheinheimera baltica TaxID=67576 RepID=UPI00273D4A4E|nr:hypothetical protein [Rheinheimera baltica]MDP5143938.1 hypothetical protein [Rheinheimera baltica]
MRSLKIKERNLNTLLLARSKQSELIGFLLAAFLIASIFYSVFGQDFSNVDFMNSIVAKVKEQPLLLIVLLLLLPLIVVKKFRDVITVFAKGDCYAFNLDSKSITHNGNELVRFDDIKEVQIRVFKSDDFDSYNLSLIKNNDKSILLEEHNDLSVTKELAGNIADFIGVSVRIEN